MQSQVIECLDNCQEQIYTGQPDKTIYLIKNHHFTVTQQQYTISGSLLLQPKIYRHKSQTVGIKVENKNIQAEL